MALGVAGDKNQGSYFIQATEATEGIYCFKYKRELPEREDFQDCAHLFIFNITTFKSNWHDFSTPKHQMDKPGYFCVSKW